MSVCCLQHRLCQGYEQLTDDHLCERHTAHLDALKIIIIIIIIIIKSIADKSP